MWGPSYVQYFLTLLDLDDVGEVFFQMKITVFYMKAEMFS